MDEIIVYHGGTEVVEHPMCQYGRSKLDFGKGFYVTNLREQAVSWAINMATLRQKKPVINRYKLYRKAILEEARCKVFHSYDVEWLEFIVGNRTGKDLAAPYDYVEGGVANDRVIDTINLYMTGLMGLDIALKELSKHQPNNQICLLNQELMDKYLIFDGTESI